MNGGMVGNIGVGWMRLVEWLSGSGGGVGGGGGGVVDGACRTVEWEGMWEWCGWEYGNGMGRVCGMGEWEGMWEWGGWEYGNGMGRVSGRECGSGVVGNKGVE